MTELNLLTKISLTTAFALLALLLSIAIIRWLIRTMRVEADQIETLKIKNQGNCACQYHLAVTTSAPNLQFSLYDEGAHLAPVFEEIEEEIVEEQEIVKEKGQENSTKAAPDASQQRATKTEKINSGDALKKGQDVSAKAGVAANFLGILGSILPGKLGQSVKGTANTARNAQKKSASAIQAPRSAQRKMDAMKKSSSRLGVKADSVQEASIGQPKIGSRKNGNKRDQTGHSRSSRNIVRKVKRTVEKAGVFQTVDISPGEALFLILVAGKKEKRYPSGSFSYSIESKPVPVNKALGSAPPAIKKGQVNFAPIGRWRYWMPSLSVSLYLVLLALLSYYLTLLIWT